MSAEADVKHEALLLTGPYRSGKTRRLLRSALELKALDPFCEAIIVVPSARYANLLRRLLLEELEAIPADQRLPGIFGLKILPFYEACRSVLRTVGIECRQLPDELRTHLVKSILKELSQEGRLRALKPIADFQGTVRSLAELIDEIQRAGHSPTDLKERLRASASADSLFFELAIVYQKYWEQCANLKVFDLKQIALAAREVLYEKDEPPCRHSAANEAGEVLSSTEETILASKLQSENFVGKPEQRLPQLAPVEVRAGAVSRKIGDLTDCPDQAPVTVPGTIVPALEGAPLSSREDTSNNSDDVLSRSVSDFAQSEVEATDYKFSSSSQPRAEGSLGSRAEVPASFQSSTEPMASEYGAELWQAAAVDTANVMSADLQLFIKDAPRKKCPPLLYDLLLIDGFDRISHLQAQVFGGLAKHARSTVLSFDYIIPSPPANSAAPRQAAASETAIVDNASTDYGGMRFTASDQHSINSRVVQTSDDYQWKDESWSELLSALHAEVEVVPPAQRGGQVIECFTCLDRFVEMREIARRCKEAIMMRQLDPREILVIARSTDAYAGAIEAAFDDAGLDYYIDGSVRVVDLALWHFVRRLLSLADNDYARLELVDLLRSPYFNAEACNLTPESLSRIDRESHKKELVSGLESWKKFFALDPEKFTDERVGIFKLLDMLAAILQDEISLDSRIARTEDLLETFLRLPANDRHSRSMKARLENEFIRVLRRAFKTMLMQESILGSQPESGQEFIDRLLKMLENASFARPVGQRTGIAVCSADLAPGRCFKEIYIAGAVEGDFPRRTVGRGFLAADQVARWLSFGIDLQNPRAEPGFEQALFYSLIERAQDRVVLSLPQFEMDGAEPVPSFYLKELEEKAGTKLLKAPLFSEALRNPASVSEALSAAAWLGGFDYCEILAGKHPVMRERTDEVRSGFEAAISRISADRNQIYNAYLSDFVSTGALKIPLPEAWTASKLNKFGQCPFRFWVGEILKMEPREEAQAGITAFLRGDVYHKVLELFFSSHRIMMQDDGVAALDQEEQDSIISALIEDAFTEALQILDRKPFFIPGPWWEQEKKEMLFRITRFIKKELRRIAADKDQFAPALFEVEFGTDSPTASPALIIPLANDEVVVLRGTVDRIDLPGGKIPSGSTDAPVRVLDYKTGGKPISVRDAFSGRNIQIPIYALAVEQAILPGSSVMSGLYMSISQGKATGVLAFDSEAHSDIPARTVGLISDFVSRIKLGQFVPAPSARDVCNHCPHRTACRVKELKGFTEAEVDASD